MPGGRKRLLLIHTGGTLGMTGQRPSALKPGRFLAMVKRRIPELSELADLDFELFSNIDSAEMQPELWTRLARRLHQALPDYDGAVVTHGTDTLAHTAAALSFMLPGLPRPVVLTGAQRPLQQIRSDARLNLIDAVTSASLGPSEVTVCFDSRLYRGNRVRKVSTFEYDAFDSPNCSPLGLLGVSTRFEPGLKRKGPFKLLDGLDPRVFLLRVFPGLDPGLVVPLLPHVRGLVVEAYGAGTFPVSRALGRSLEVVLDEARAQEVTVLIVSQAHRNGVDLSMYESGELALRLGAVAGGDMTPAAAVVKLMHALALYPRGGPELRAYLERSVAGERN